MRGPEGTRDWGRNAAKTASVYTVLEENARALGKNYIVFCFFCAVLS